jgi:biofilm protein TabA
MIVDHIDNWTLYSKAEVWRVAFEYLCALSPDAEPTEMTPVMGEDVMARVMHYDTRTVDEAVLEAHNQYVDIQMTLDGGEGIDWFSRAALMEKAPYDPVNDVVFFHRPDTVAPVRVSNLPGRFCALFPNDAHSPQLVLGDASGAVKKVVVKIRASAL